MPLSSGRGFRDGLTRCAYETVPSVQCFTLAHLSLGRSAPPPFQTSFDIMKGNCRGEGRALELVAFVELFGSQTIIEAVLRTYFEEDRARLLADSGLSLVG